MASNTTSSVASSLTSQATNTDSVPQNYYLYRGELHGLDKEFIHCSEILQFFWFLFVLLMLVASIIRAFILKRDVNSKDGLYTQYAGEVEKQKKPDTDKNPKDEQNTKSPIKQGNQPEMKMADEAKDVEKQEEKPNIIRIDDDDDNPPKDEDKAANEQNSDQIIKDDEIVMEEKQPQKNDNTDAKKRRDEEEKEKNKPAAPIQNVIDQHQQTDKKQKFCDSVQKILDYHMPFMAIAILLIASWGSYIFSVFALFCIFLMLILVNRMQIFQNTEERQKNIELGYHFWIITLFLNYLINDQQYE